MTGQAAQIELFETVNVFGRLYVTREAIAAFERRAIGREFARESQIPARKKRTKR